MRRVGEGRRHGSRVVHRIAAIAWALVATLVAGSRADAQTTSDIPPPVRYLVDENGIDVARGEHLINVTDVSIGPEGPGGLAYTRQLRRNGGGNPYDMGLFQNGSTWTATTRLRSYTFTLSGSTFTSTDGSGARLVRSGTVDTLTEPDGTVVVYDYVTLADNDVDRRSRASRVEYPSGEVLTLQWYSEDMCPTNEMDICSEPLVRVVRLQAVETSLRYQLRFTYGNSGINNPNRIADWQTLHNVTAVNAIHDDCDPYCDAGWPTASYSGNSVTDPAGRTSSYTSTSTAFRIRRAGSGSDDVVYNYDASGKIDSVVRDGMTWNYSYSVSGNSATMTVTDPGSHTRTIVSNLTVGLPTSVTNEVNQTTTYTYLPSGLLDRATAPEGNYIDYDYDTRGNVTAITRGPKTGQTGTIRTTADYPDSCTNTRTCNRPITTTDARNNVTEYFWDPQHGGIRTVTAPAGPNGIRPQTRYTYTAYPMLGGGTSYRVTTISSCRTQATCAGTADEAVTEIGYTDPNLLTSGVTRRNGTSTLSATTSMAYDPVGNLVTVNGPLASTVDVVRTRYNLAREVTGIISPDPDGGGSLLPRAQRLTRSATTGLVTRVEAGTLPSATQADWTGFAALERVDVAYDARQRPVQRTLAGADGVVQALTRMNYDAEGRPWCTAIRMNPAEFDTPLADACARDTTGSFGADRITRTSYDAANRAVRVETAVGVAALVADEVRTQYTTNGRVANVLDANNNRTTYEYDGFDRLVRTRYPTTPVGSQNSSQFDDEVLTLDANGNVTNRAMRNNNSIAYEYDALNRLWTKDPSAAGEPTVTYNYDNLGRLASATDGSMVLGFDYDALGRNTSQTGPFGTTGYQYDAAGRRTQLSYPGTSLVIHYDYLYTGEMRHIRENGATSGVGVLATFGYDQLGRRSSLTRGNGTST
ncbi:MAG TPA: hypothetical protein VF704_12740, partial [Allosphingosinicella sp.]